MFGNRGGIRPGRRANQNAACGSRLNVNDIDAAAMFGNHLQCRGGIHNGGSDVAIAHQDGDGIVLLAQRDQLGLCRLAAGKDKFVIFQHPQRRVSQIAAGNQYDIFSAHGSVSPSLSIPA